MDKDLLSQQRLFNLELGKMSMKVSILSPETCWD